MVRKTVLQKNFAEYLVGWICTQPAEFAAARAMLDDEHGMPENQSPADRNTYFLGRMGPHNVAIACLPTGTPGNMLAATVATDMQRTFQGVRVSLLVGVGSGAPSAVDDIRLGDVVISRPMGNSGGVIQCECAPIFNRPR
jgi:nucleoside phosphorylase